MKKEHRKKYHTNWEMISMDIRINRAGNRCEKCNVKNKDLIRRTHTDKWIQVPFEVMEQLDDIRNRNYREFLQTLKACGIVQIVLTVAHLDQDPSNNDYSNLMALCQRCHLNHDRSFNVAKMRMKN
jgi:hypothetical protein